MRSEEERQILQPSDKPTLSGQDGSKTPIGELCILFLHVDKDVYFFFQSYLKIVLLMFWHMEKGTSDLLQVSWWENGTVGFLHPPAAIGFP